MVKHELSREVLIHLINQTLNGSPERREAAKFILDCVRAGYSKEKIAQLIEAQSFSGAADDARSMALSLGLIG